jgi:hypothetical protein
MIEVERRWSEAGRGRNIEIGAGRWKVNDGMAAMRT